MPRSVSPAGPTAAPNCCLLVPYAPKVSASHAHCEHWLVSDDGPPSRVLADFGVDSVRPVSLPGGEGRSWRAGDIVLKPAEDAVAARCVAEVFSTLPGSGAVRAPRPVSTISGAWVSGGWAAWSWLPGETATGRWREIIAAGTALHALLAETPRPAFLDARDDVWAIGDRVAWGEQPLVIEHERFRTTAQALAARLVPCSERSQLVHGDLTGNVLVFDGLPPAVIDMSCYWRPPSWALAIVAADALAWHGTGPEVVALLPGPHSVAMVARAALYRLVTSDRHAAGLRSERAPYLADNGAAYDRVLDVLDALARQDRVDRR